MFSLFIFILFFALTLKRFPVCGAVLQLLENGLQVKQSILILIHIILISLNTQISFLIAVGNIKHSCYETYWLHLLLFILLMLGSIL